MLAEFTHPVLLIDRQKCYANIRRMLAKATRNGARLRPHFKTHQSAAVGEWFREFGIDRITVSSLRMAEYFARAGWDDITVAFPFNLHEIALANRLAANTQLNLLVASADTMRYLVKHAAHPLGFYLEIDTGYHRTGIPSHDHQQLDVILQIAKENQQLQFQGFLAHPGHSYESRAAKGLAEVHAAAKAQLLALKAAYRSDYPHLELSLGDTPCCSVCEDYEGIDEMRPGNFVFYDLTQVAIGACSVDEVAVAMHCPVVACYPERQEVVIYGGGVHFSKDRLTLAGGRTIYGQVVSLGQHGWQADRSEVYLTKLSQEHGTVRGPRAYIDSLRVGDWLTVLPVHSCMTADLQSAYYDLDGKRYEIMEKLT
jgi:D-serine deaminase-like pyridoxal phosphate-dependent protein